VHIPRHRPTDRAEHKEWFEWYTAWWPTPDARDHRRSEWSSVARVEQDGSFLVENAPPGPYRLTSSLSGPPRAHPLGLGLVAPGRPIATLAHDLEVPAAPEADAAGEIDLGVLTLETVDYFEPGEAAPLFSAKTLDGEAFALKDLRGKYVFLDFWATWCGPCIKEMPNLKELHAALGRDERLVIIGVSIDDDAAAPRDFVRKQGLEWMQIILEDPEARKPILESYGIRGVPATFLIGPDGSLLARDLRGPEARKVIERELGARGR
jgi:thiol-disulfide isomerase/thioredoxin